MIRLILLDRDGVINQDSPHYVKDAHEWTEIPGSLAAIARLKEAGYLVAICSNQAGVGRGILTSEALERIHARMTSALRELGVTLDGVRYCIHHPDDDCPCRKPRPGMLLETLAHLEVQPEHAVMVGDRVRDVQAALAAGVRPVLVRTGGGAGDEAEARQLGVRCIADDLAAFARCITGTPSC